MNSSNVQIETFTEITDVLEQRIFAEDLSFNQLTSLINQLIECNKRYNATIGPMDGKLMDDSFKTIKIARKYIELARRAAEQQDFTTLFENVMKLKIHVSSTREMDTFINNTNMNTLLHAYSTKLSKLCFHHLEKMEQLSNLTFSKSLLD